MDEKIKEIKRMVMFEYGWLLDMNKEGKLNKCAINVAFKPLIKAIDDMMKEGELNEN